MRNKKKQLKACRINMMRRIANEMLVSTSECPYAWKHAFGLTPNEAGRILLGKKDSTLLKYMLKSSLPEELGQGLNVSGHFYGIKLEMIALIQKKHIEELHSKEKIYQATYKEKISHVC